MRHFGQRAAKDRGDSRRGRAAVVMAVVLVAWLTVAGGAQAAPSDDGRPRDTAPEGMVTASVSAGTSHTCGVRTDATVACWGDNTSGRATPPAGTFTSVSAGGAHTCGVRTDATVACWGDNSDGQATPPAGTFTSVSAGGNHTCGVRTDATVACWGQNLFGQATPPAGTFTSVSAGGLYTCGVRTDATVACWGQNRFGEATPQAGTFTSVSAGDFHTCGVRTDATVACWGFNGNGRATPPAGTFTLVSAVNVHTCGVRTDATVACWGDNGFGQATPPGGTFTSVSAGTFHTCGVRTDATVACWGFNGNGRATPPASTFASPSVEAGDVHTCGVRTDATVACWGENGNGQASPPAGTFTQVSAGGFHTCGVRTDATVACWGHIGFGQSSPPAGTFTQVSAGDVHTCGVRTDATVACWGDNFFGQSSPPAGTFTQVSAGDVHTCGVRTDGTVACWGRNGLGQSSPPAGTFTQVSAGSDHTCGVRTDATVACWGRNAEGQSSPPAGTFTQVSAGAFHTCGVRTDGTVACWGLNNFGQASPPPGTFTQVSAGNSHTCGVRTDGTVACWGDNGNGQFALTVTSPAPPAGEVGEAYSHQFATTYASPTPTYALTSGTLPAGLGLSPAGLLSGTPTTAGTSGPLTVCASNDLAPEGCQTFTLTVEEAVVPTISTQASAGGPLGTAVTDTATVSGGSNPTGTVTFKLFSDTTCATQVGAGSTKTLTTGSATSDPITPTAAGTYWWTADYSKDANNSAVSSPCEAPNESVVITKATPTVATQADASAALGQPISDTGTVTGVSGAAVPTGTVVFTAFGPDNATCAGDPAFISPAQLLAGGPPPPANSGPFTPSALGTYRWKASYSGDTNYNPLATACNDPGESSRVEPPGFVTSFTPTNLRNDFNGWVGLRLVAGPTDVAVTSLARWVVAGNTATHRVRLVDAATGADVPGGSAVVNTAGATAGSFAYTDIAPVTLVAGRSYDLLSEEFAGGDTWYDYTTHVVTSGVGTDVAAAYAFAATPGSIVAGGSPGDAYGPPNFRYATPAPAGAMVSAQPGDQRVVAGDTATFSAAATGTPTPSVQWQVKAPAGAFIDIARATSPTLVVAGTTLSQSGNQYRAVFTNSSGTATTNPATLTVTAAPPPPLGDAAWITSFTPSSLRNDFSGWVGARVAVGPADVSVTALGRWVVAGNTGSHALRLVNATGVDVATATVNTAGKPAGAFTYAALGSPVTLNGGATYYLLTQESAGGDAWYEYNLSTATTAVAADTGAAFATNASPGAVAAGGSPGQAYGPPNFLYAAATPPPPPPTGTALVTSFSPSALRNDFTGWVGMRLVVGSTNLSVSALGRWSVGADTASHTLRLVNAATGADVASAVLNAAGTPAGAFAYANLASPVTLAAGQTYFLLSHENAGGDRWYDYDTRTVTTTAAADTGVAYAGEASPNSVVVGGGPNQSYGPPNLLYTVMP